MIDTLATEVAELGKHFISLNYITAFMHVHA